MVASLTAFVTVFFFDCLYFEGEDLIDQPANQRITALEKTLPAGLVIRRLGRRCSNRRIGSLLAWPGFDVSFSLAECSGTVVT